MSYSITNLKQELTGVLHGTQLNQITSVDQLIFRAARDVLMDVDPQETIRTIPITNSVFNSVWDYPCPVDLKGNRVIDIRPQVSRKTTDLWLQWYNQSFDRLKGSSLLDSFTIQWDTAVKTMRINAPSLIAPIPLNTCDSLTSNGTWAVFDDASNLSVDNVNYVSGGGSLSFDLIDSGSSGGIENKTMNPVDLSAWVNQGTFFAYVYLPTGSVYSEIVLSVGNDDANFYEMDTSVTQQGTSFQDGWNLLKFDWNSATVGGTPDPSSIKYALVGMEYDGTAQTGVRLDQITCALGTILEIEYYSRFLFRDASTGAFQETITDDSNLVNLDTETYNLLMYKVAELSAQQQQGVDALGYDGPYFKKEYETRLDRYRYLYKSNVQKVTDSYYGMPKKTGINRIRRGY